MVEKTAQELTPNVSFRMAAHYFDRLRERAEALEQSPGQLARYLVIQALEDTGRLNLEDEVRALRLEITKFRAEFAQAIDSQS